MAGEFSLCLRSVLFYPGGGFLRGGRGEGMRRGGRGLEDGGKGLMM